MKKVQLGIINISDDIDGVPSGIINYSKPGIFDVSTWRDETGIGLATLRSESRNLYISYSAGYDPASNNHPYALVLGAGVDKNLGRAMVGLDVIAFFVKARVKTRSPENYLTRFRIPVGLRINSGFSIFAGPSFNILFTDNDPALISPVGNYQHKVGDEHYVWPGFFVGLRIGRFGL